MNTTLDDGGPAFPVPGMPPVGTGDPRDGMAGGCDPQPGMSLRDWFAGMALQGYTGAASIHSAIGREELKAEEIAYCCYEWADQMLAARKEAR